MRKRQLADRILDEVLVLRRPRPVVVELDEREDRQTAQDRVNESASSTTRRRLIVE